jgi:hypothetical protein
MSDIRELLAAFGRFIDASRSIDASTDFVIVGIPSSAGLVPTAGFRTREEAEAFLLTTDVFGTCPHCSKADGFIAMGQSVWLYCTTHKTKWLAAYASWIEDNREAQEQRFDEINFGNFEYVGPHAEEYRKRREGAKP